MSALRPEVRAKLDQMAALTRPPLNGLPPEELQAVIQQTLIATADPVADAVARIEDLVIPGGAGQPLPLRLYARDATGAPAGPVVLFFHGGGFMTGNLDTHDGLASRIAELSGYTVISVDYRLAPQHPYPAAVDDALAALHWLTAAPREIGHAVPGIVVAGDSAGGNLAAVCAQHASAADLPVDVQWLMYATVHADATGGSFDEFGEGHLLTAAMMRTFRDAYFGDQDRTSPTASPLLGHLDERTPPALVFTCEFDPLRDQARDYAARLVRNGVSVRYREGRGLTHGAFAQLRSIPSALDDLRGCIDDLHSLIGEATDAARWRDTTPAPMTRTS